MKTKRQMQTGEAERERIEWIAYRAKDVLTKAIHLSVFFFFFLTRSSYRHDRQTGRGIERQIQREGGSEGGRERELCTERRYR